MLPAVRAVLFDLDNTLHDRDAAFRRWAERFAAERLGLVPETAPFQEVVAEMIARDDSGYGSKPALFTTLRERHASALPENVETLVERFHAALVRETRLEAETQALLDRLGAARIPFGIVTNGSARQQRKIVHLGLDRRTDCVLISGVFGARKPDPAIFLAAATRLGVASEDTGTILFVGDHPENDICGAQGAGMRTAWVHRGMPTWPAALADSPPDLAVRSVADLSPYLFGGLW